MELKRYLALLRRWAWLPGVFMLAGAAFGLGLSLYLAPVYQSSVKLLLDSSRSTSAGADYNSVMASQSLAQTYSQMLVARPVLDKVITALSLPLTTEQLLKRVTVSVVRNTQLIALSVEDTDPDQAARVANEIVAEFERQNQDLQTSRYDVSEKAIQSQLATIQADMAHNQAGLDALQDKTAPADIAERNRLDNLLAQDRTSSVTLLQTLEEIRLAEAQSSNNLVVLEPARAEPVPVRPKTTLNTVLGTIIGLLLSLGFVFLRDYLDDSIKSGPDAEHLTGLPTLGTIALVKGASEADKVVTLSNPRSAAAEAYRVLATNIEFTTVDHPIRTLLVNSGSPAEGKTTTVANLAVALVQMGKRVIVVDGDLRQAALHRCFAVPNTRGLTSALLAHDAKVEDYLQPTDLDNLRVLPSGPLPPNPGELLGSQRMVDLIEELKTRADIVLFDSPPLLAVAEAGLLARASDATLLVVACWVTRNPGLKHAQEQLQQTGTRLIGLVLNRAAPQAEGYRYYSAGTGHTRERGPLSHRRGLRVPFWPGNPRKRQAEPTAAGRAVENESLGG